MPRGVYDRTTTLSRGWKKQLSALEDHASLTQNDQADSRERETQVTWTEVNALDAHLRRAEKRKTHVTWTEEERQMVTEAALQLWKQKPEAGITVSLIAAAQITALPQHRRKFIVSIATTAGVYDRCMTEVRRIVEESAGWNRISVGDVIA